jgi:AbrB family looped-hinge helix DNA binding protein
MKETGIIRRIDDLGRIIIPREIRRTMNLHEGDPMEIYLENGFVMFKKYFAENEFVDCLNNIIDSIREHDNIHTSDDIVKKIQEAISLFEVK